ncbi:MAG: SDR family NAD(P)-dependent oxidoreductase, partial [Brevibacterium aurantiacum]
MSEKLPYGTNLPTGDTASEATAVPSETIALITGGARGIGRHLSEAFAKAGYDVIVTATSAEKAEAAAEEIAEATGGAVTGVGLRTDDITVVNQLRDSVAELEKSTGKRLQVLINNAGRIESTEGPLWDADPESL